MSSNGGHWIIEVLCAAIINPIINFVVDRLLTNKGKLKNWDWKKLYISSCIISAIIIGICIEFSPTEPISTLLILTILTVYVIFSILTYMTLDYYYKNKKYVAENKIIEQENDNLNNRYNVLKDEKDKLDDEYNTLKEENNILNNKYNILKDEKDKIVSQKKCKEKSCENILSKYNVYEAVQANRDHYNSTINNLRDVSVLGDIGSKNSIQGENTIRYLLNLICETIKKTVGETVNCDYLKVTLAIPVLDGSFYIFPSGLIPPYRITDLENKSRWKGVGDMGGFYKGMNTEELYITLKREDKIEIKPKDNYKPSKADITIPLRKENSKYEIENNYKNFYGIVSIGNEDVKIIEEVNAEKIYDAIEGILRCLECIIINEPLYIKHRNKNA